MEFAYDANDLGDLWEDFDEMEMFKVAAEDDWGCGLLDVKPQVIIRDCLFTDAALGTAPIKTEHSYCSSLAVSVDSPPQSPLKMEEDDDECFPPMKLQRCHRLQRTSPAAPAPQQLEVKDEHEDEEEEDEEDDDEEEEVLIKDEPLSEPESPMSSCPPSPAPSPSPPPPPHYHSHKLKSGQSLLKQQSVMMSRGHHLLMPSTLSIKLEPHSSAFTLPPTPPSSTSSDSEGGVSPAHPSSPSRRLFLSASSSRQPIQTPLISSQPKGSTGVLMLTEEEKRTLLAEGYQIPTRLPLTKAEEKSLKKIRRKIKNKISAQESRRKKKEYMDTLERKVEQLSSENTEFRKKITGLEDRNVSLVSQLRKLQAIVARSHNLTQHSRSAK